MKIKEIKGSIINHVKWKPCVGTHEPQALTTTFNFMGQLKIEEGLSSERGIKRTNENED